MQVKLTGALARQLPGGIADVELADGAPIGALADRLGLSVEHCVFVVNGRAVRVDCVLQHGDRVQAFPPMAGG